MIAKQLQKEQGHWCGWKLKTVFSNLSCTLESHAGPPALRYFSFPGNCKIWSRFRTIALEELSPCVIFKSPLKQLFFPLHEAVLDTSGLSTFERSREVSRLI